MDSATFRILTPRGKGAVASISVQGDIGVIDRYFQPVNQQSITEQKVNRICYGNWNGEDVVCTRVDESSVEIHCHGGLAAVNRICSDLQLMGVLQTSQSLIAELSYEQEIFKLLTAATTRRTAHFLLLQADLFPAAMRDFDELSDAEETEQRIQEMLRWSEFGLHLIKPWKVVLCGSPNVGKSSLINALVGFSRTVVFDQPGTTRDVVTVETAFQGWPIEFSDTAGLRETEDGLESIGIERARRHISESECIVLVSDAVTGLTSFEFEMKQQFPDALLVRNKIDLTPVADSQPAIPVSAKTGAGVDRLAKAIVRKLIPEVPSEGQAFPVSHRQVDDLRKLLTIASKGRNESPSGPAC